MRKALIRAFGSFATAGLILGLSAACSTSGGSHGSGVSPDGTPAVNPDGTPAVNPDGSPNPGGTTTGAPTGPGVTPVDTTAPIIPVIPFDPLAPDVYAAKVKDVLTGLPLSDAEYLRVKADPTTIKALIDEWMLLPSFKTKMLEFFTQAFQQDGTELADFNDQFGGGNISGWPTSSLFLNSLSSSFAQTAWELVVAGDRPFTETVTTRSFMLNLPLMVALSYIDAAPVSDSKTQTVSVPWLLTSNTQTAHFLATTDGHAAVPLADTLNPASPNYMVWTYTPLKGVSGCGDVTKKGAAILQNVFEMMMGFGPTAACNKVQTIFTDADWSTYKLVTIRHPNPGEKKAVFWDPTQLGNQNELVLDTERIGFMTTPAFFSHWATNDSNVFRVTVNQSLIVAIGKSIEPIGTTIPLNDANLQGEHAAPGSPCYACHVTLDPAREFFHQSYSYFYSRRDPNDTKYGMVPAKSVFSVFNSPPIEGNGVSDFANALIQHPLYPTAWAEKFCEYANSGDCSADDPELLRIGEAFKAGGYKLKSLIRETFASPVVTFATPTKTSDDFGVAVGIARREVFCQRLTERLQIPDACNLAGMNPLGAAVKTAPKLALGVPNAGFARGEPRAVLPRDPNLFFADGTEKLCVALANGLIGVATPKWAPAQKEAAFDDFVGTIMGVPPSDPRAAPLRVLLSSHYDDAIAAKAKDTDALRSTFVVACSSPLGVSSGL